MPTVYLNMNNHKRAAFLQHFKNVFSILLTVVVLMLLASCASSKKHSANSDDAKKTETSQNKKTDTVPVHSDVTLFIMTGCPHCATALKTLLPLYSDLGGAMNLSIEYIGAVQSGKFPELSMDDPQVAAAAAEVCAKEGVDNSVWLSFMKCLYKDDLWKNAQISWEKCADKNSINTTEVTKCLLSSKGREKLAMSMMGASLEGINAAPAIFIDGKQYYGSSDRKALLTRICYNNKNRETMPSICNNIKQPEQIKAVLLNDKRCNDEQACNVSKEVEFLKALIPDALVETIDYSSKEGKEFYKNMVNAKGPATLPAIYFESDFKDNKAISASLGRYFVPFKNGVFLPLGLKFNPTFEICGNSKDDDDNGLIDCDDKFCSEKMECREEKKARLDLFIMSKCPYAAMITPAVDHFLNHLKEHNSFVELRLQFIGTINDDELISMHGSSEIEEDMRMACIQDIYSKDNKYFDYVLCRLKRLEDDDWESCLQPKMKKRKIDKCTNGNRGKELLKESFKLAAATDLQGSPSWMLNNRFEMQARTAKEILQQYCLKNEAKACTKKIKKMLIDSVLAAPGSCK